MFGKTSVYAVWNELSEREKEFFLNWNVFGCVDIAGISFKLKFYDECVTMH